MLEEPGIDVQRKNAPGKNEAYWREEVVANTVPSILGNEATMKSFVAKMAGSDAATRNVFVEFLDVISDFLKNAFDKLKNKLAWKQMQAISENQKAVERIRDAYFEALDGMMAKKETSSEAEEVYPIQYTKDNVPFVVTERDILDGVPEKDCGLRKKP